jgi:hypothetical protein
MKLPYRFGIFRYVHDTATQEFVSIGVAVASQEAGYLRARCTADSARIARMFETIDEPGFRETIRCIEARLNTMKFQGATQSLESAVAAVLPPDDSAVQFKTAGVGLSTDLDSTLNQLYMRYVCRYTASYKPVHS